MKDVVDQHQRLVTIHGHEHRRVQEGFILKGVHAQYTSIAHAPIFGIPSERSCDSGIDTALDLEIGVICNTELTCKVFLVPHLGQLLDDL